VETPEIPSVEPEGNESPTTDTEQTPSKRVDLDELRERIRSGEHVPPQWPMHESQEAHAAGLPTAGDPGGGPTLDEIRQAIREGRGTGPQPTMEEIQREIERDRQSRQGTDDTTSIGE
jgi:hypothetical protein